MPFMSQSFDRLIAVMDRLRDPGGCPWDREQTLSTLAPYLIEEAHEVTEAVAAGDPDDVCHLSTTSGTTGRPKAAMLTHRNLVANIEQTLAPAQIGEDETIVAVLPFFARPGLSDILAVFVDMDAQRDVMTGRLARLPDADGIVGPEHFQDLVGRSGLVMVSHQEATLKEFCTSGVWLHEGRVHWFDEIGDALKAYKNSLSS